MKRIILRKLFKNRKAHKNKRPNNREKLPLIAVLGFTRAKLGEIDSSNADSFQWNLESGIVAISDGVSRSYLPEVWSRLLVKEVVEAGVILRVEQIERLVEGLATPTENDEQWFTTELKSKGSHATLMSCQFKKSGTNYSVALRTIGDCCAFQIRNGNFLRSWPFHIQEDFPVRPTAISSLRPFGLSDEIETTWELIHTDKILLVTDAIGRFSIGALERNSEIQVTDLFPFLSSISSSQELFAEWADHVRVSGSMEDDDLSLIEISMRKI